MNLAIIGSGTIVQEFLPHLAALEGLTLTALLGTPRSAEKVRSLAKTYGIPHPGTDFAALAASGADTVYVAVPNHLHFTYCKQALEAGLHVIVEKPMTSNLREAEALAALAAQKGLLLFEAITTLHLGNYKKLAEWLPRIGEIKLVQSDFCQYSRRYDAFLRGEVLPAFDPAKSGGALMDLGLYNLHFVLGLFGAPAAAQYHANLARGIDTSGVLTLQYPDFQAVCVAAKDCKGAVGGLIQGTKGVLRSALPANAVGKITLELNDGTLEEYDDGAEAARMVPEFTAFAAAVAAHDTAFCEALLAKSLAVSAVQTAARLAAGVRFAADEGVL